MTETLKINGPGELAAAVPFLLGFTPTESLVLVGMAGGRIAVTTRCDIEQGLWEESATVVRNGGCDIVIAVVYDDNVPDYVDADRIIQVTAGSAWCDGHAYPLESLHVAAEAVGRGLAPVDTRAALVDEMRPITGDVIRSEIADEMASALDNIVSRDEAWLEAEQADDAGLRELAACYLKHARHARASAALWTLAGWCYWRVGDGTRASIATGEALTIDPDYTMARLLESTLSNGLNPFTTPRLSA